MSTSVYWEQTHVLRSAMILQAPIAVTVEQDMSWTLMDEPAMVCCANAVALNASIHLVRYRC